MLFNAMPPNIACGFGLAPLPTSPFRGLYLTTSTPLSLTTLNKAHTTQTVPAALQTKLAKKYGGDNMSTLKEFFEKGEDGKLTYEEFEALTKEAGAKFKDLSTGQYVSIGKYEADLKSAQDNATALQEQIDSLNSTITTRDEDLANLQKKFEEAEGDSQKLAETRQSLTDMQTKYEAQLAEQQSLMQKHRSLLLLSMLKLPLLPPLLLRD